MRNTYFSLISIAFLYSSFLISIIPQDDVNPFDKKNIRNPVTQVFYVHGIKNTDLTPATQDGSLYTISTSGTYYLGSNLVLNPTNTGVRGIKINTSNVTLNLNGKTISTGSSGSQAGVAIEVAAGLSGIKILNGNINGIKGAGIKIAGTSGSKCGNIQISDLTINNCNALGMNVQYANNLTIENVNITNCTSSGVNDEAGKKIVFAIGLELANSNNVYVKNSLFNNNIVGTAGQGPNYGIGVEISGCKDCVFENCSASTNSGKQSTDGVPQQGNGFGFFVNLFSTYLDSVTSACKGCKFINCRAINNNCSLTSGYAYGFEIQNSSGNTFENCIASSQAALGSESGQSIGFSFVSSNGNVIKNCKAFDNNTNSASNNSFGFKFDQCKGNIITDSEAISNTSEKKAYGFYLELCSNNTLRNCTASNNNADAGATANSDAYGFFSNSGTANIFERCNSNGHKAGTQSTNIAAGFALIGLEKASVISECKISGNNGNGGEGYGIKFGSSGSTITRCTVKDCIVMGTGGNTKIYGFKDFSANCTSAILGNIFGLNGTKKILPVTVNTDGTYSIPDNGPVTGSPSGGYGGTGGQNIMFTFTTVGENPTNILIETDNSNWQTVSTKVDGFTNILIVETT